MRENLIRMDFPVQQRFPGFNPFRRHKKILLNSNRLKNTKNFRNATVQPDNNLI